MNYTSIEQSKKLLEHGLSPESADMCYLNEAEFIGKVEYTEHPYLLLDDDELSKTDLPCWSVGTLLEIIPFSTQTTTSYKKGRVDVIYHPDNFEGSIHTEKAETLLEALIQTIVWLLENNYIKH